MTECIVRKYDVYPRQCRKCHCVRNVFYLSKNVNCTRYVRPFRSVFFRRFNLFYLRPGYSLKRYRILMATNNRTIHYL